MIKKVISAVLALLIVVSLSACGKVQGNGQETTKGEQRVTAKVINNKGVTEYLTAKDLMSLYSENDLAFKQDYWCAKVTVTGKITEVSGAKIINGSHYDWTIEIDGNWFVGKTKNNESNVTEDFIAKLRNGDVVTISGEIVGAWSNVNISNGTISVTKN